MFRASGYGVKNSVRTVKIKEEGFPAGRRLGWWPKWAAEEADGFGCWQDNRPKTKNCGDAETPIRGQPPRHKRKRPANCTTEKRENGLWMD